jgi:hypothetical protein
MGMTFMQAQKATLPRSAFPLVRLSLMPSSIDENIFFGLCGVCSIVIQATGASDGGSSEYGSRCDRHNLYFCKGCLGKSPLPVPCEACAREAARGSADPVLRSLGRYAAQTLESDVGTPISYINYDLDPKGEARYNRLVRWIELMSSYENVNNPFSNADYQLTRGVPFLRVG